MYRKNICLKFALVFEMKVVHVCMDELELFLLNFLYILGIYMAKHVDELLVPLHG